MKKFLVVLAIGLLTASLAFAGATEEADDDEIIIGFNNGSTTVDFLRLVGESMVREAENYGVKLLVAESNFDPEKILPNVDNLLLQGADIIVDFNVNAEIGGSLVDYCGEKGVSVIGIDVAYTGVNGDQAWFFGANNQMAGYVAGEGLAAEIKDRWDGEIEQALFFHNSENGPVVRLRMSGMVDGMRDNGITITDDMIEWIEMGGGGSDTTLVANQKMTDWLTAHPDLTKIVIGTVNSETGQGVFSAAQAQNRDADCLLATNNNGNQAIAAMEMGDNMWLGGTAYYPNRYGEYIIPLAISIVNGENPDKMQTMEHVFLTRKDLDEIKANAQ